MSFEEDRLRAMLADRALFASGSVAADPSYLRKVRNRRIKNIALSVALVMLMSAGGVAGARYLGHTKIQRPVSSESQWKTFKGLNFAVFRYPPNWFASEQRITKFGEIVIGNTNADLTAVRGYRCPKGAWGCPGSPFGLSNAGLGAKDVFVVLARRGFDDPRKDLPDTSPDDPPVLTSDGWSTIFRHHHEMIGMTVLAGVSPERADLENARRVIRSLTFEDPTLPPVDTSAISGVTDVAGIDAQNAFAVVARTCQAGRPCPGGMLRTHDGGKTWTQVKSLPEFYADNYVPDGWKGQLIEGKVFFVTPRIGWLYGEIAFETRDGGATWRKTDATNVSTITGSRSRLWEWSTGCPGSIRSNCNLHVRTSTDLGVTWSKPSQVDALGMARMSFAIAGDKHAYVMVTQTHATYFKSLEETTDAGATWTSVAQPKQCPQQPDEGHAAIGMLNGSLILMCGGESGVSTAEEEIVFRRAGTQWVRIAQSSPLPPGGSRGSANKPGTTLGEAPPGSVAVMWGFGGRIFADMNRYGLYTSTSGDVWRNAGISGFDGGEILDVQFPDPQDGWTSSGGSVYATHDGGSTWTKLALPMRV